MSTELMVIADKIKADLVIDDYTMPEEYNMESAIKAAEIVWRENNGFKNCSVESKRRAIMDMMVQGLNPLKGQCAFVPFGNVLQLIREYPGSIMVAKREDPRIVDIRAQVIRRDDIFDYEMINGISHINKHKRTIEGWNSEIIGAYCVAIGLNGEIIDMDLMSMDDVKNTWKQTRLKCRDSKSGKFVPVVDQNGNVHPDSNHAKYPEKMTKKTVIQRLCRQIISSSPNTKLLTSAMRSDEGNTIQDDIRITVNEEANKKLLDFPSNDVEKQEVIETEAMATEDHFNRIKTVRQAANMGSNIMEDISGFVGREIKRVRELTATEANSYIDAISVGIDDESTGRRKPDFGR